LTVLEKKTIDKMIKGKETFIERLFNKKIPIGKLEVKLNPILEIDLSFETRPYDGEIHLRLETRPKKRD
jgi:hypothetical protein